MSDFVPFKVYLLRISQYYFILKKTAMKHLEFLTETTSRDYFRHFKYNYFIVKDKECTGAPKNLEDKELKSLLHEVSYRAQTCRIIKSWSYSNFETFESIRKDSKLLLCICWDWVCVVYSEQLKQTETISDDHCRLQLIRLSHALKKKRLLYD